LTVSFQNFLEQILTQFFKVLQLVWSFSLFTQ